MRGVELPLANSQFGIPGGEHAGFIEGVKRQAEFGNTALASGGALRVSGATSRMYMVEDWQVDSWAKLKYLRFNLPGKELRFTLDMSKMGCGCVFAMYRARCAGCRHQHARPRATAPADSQTRPPCARQMGTPGPSSANYCDILTPRPCLEFDLIEGNAHALRTTLHTEAVGRGQTRTCNLDGCGITWGNQPKNAYGAASRSCTARARRSSTPTSRSPWW